MAPRIDIAIIGAEKAGTTSLAHWLGSHPEIITHARQEFTWFVSAEERDRDLAEVWREYFPDGTGARRVLIKSVGLMVWPDATEALHRVAPAARLVCLLREPVERAYSAYWYHRRMGREPSMSFEEAIALEPRRLAAGGQAARHGSYLMRGRYAEQLERVFRLFSPSQVSVELFDDLQADPLQVYRRICTAAGIAAEASPAALQVRNRLAGVRSQALARAMNAAPVRALAAVLPRALRQRARTGLRHLNETDFTPPPLPAALAVELRSRLRPDVERLERLIGRDLAHWKAP